MWASVENIVRALITCGVAHNSAKSGRVPRSNHIYSFWVSEVPCGFWVLLGEGLRLLNTMPCTQIICALLFVLYCCHMTYVHVIEARPFPFLFGSSLLHINYKTPCRLRAIHHCHPFRRKGKKFEKGLDVLQQFGFSEPRESVSPFVFISPRRKAPISCRCHTHCDAEKGHTDTDEMKPPTHTHPQGLHTLACGLHPMPEETQEAEFRSSWRSAAPMCWGLFASRVSYALLPQHIVAARAIFLIGQLSKDRVSMCRDQANHSWSEQQQNALMSPLNCSWRNFMSMHSNFCSSPVSVYLLRSRKKTPLA